MPIPGAGFAKYFKNFFPGTAERQLKGVAKGLERAGQSGAAQTARNEAVRLGNERFMGQFKPVVPWARGAAAAGAGLWGLSKLLPEPQQSTYSKMIDPLSGKLMATGRKASPEQIAEFGKSFVPMGAANPQNRGIQDLFLSKFNQVPEMGQALSQAGMPIPTIRNTVYEHALKNNPSANMSAINAGRAQNLMNMFPGMSMEAAHANLNR